MAKILSFRNKDGAAPDQGFLTDANQTLSFRTSEDGGVSLGSLPEPSFSNVFPDPKKDWSNQELADLFRVRQLLSGANVPVETDRGVTDEGDPWFVFCHVTGEVFIHLCRIDGAYILDSPNVLRPLRGADFNDLIADFTNQALPATAEDDETERRVIRLERGGKVRLHPSAMLAALIWTLFLASEELVLLAPEKEVDTDALLDFEGVFAVAPETDAAAIETQTGADLTSASLAKDAHDDVSHGIDTQAQMRDMTGQQGLAIHQNGFAVGLSTIAIAMGFMSETVLLSNERKVLEGLKKLGFLDQVAAGQQSAELDVSADSDGSTLLAMLADFLGVDLSLNTDLAEAKAQDTEESLLQQDLKHLTQNTYTEEAALAAIKAPGTGTRKSIEDKEAEIALSETPSDVSDMALDSLPENTVRAETTDEQTSVSLSDIVLTWQPMMEATFQLDRTFVEVTFEFSQNINTQVLFDLVNSETGESLASFRQTDGLAQQLIEFIASKSDGFGVQYIGNEIIMIDHSAKTGGETEFMQWESADGKIISLIGLASDFQHFDMTA